MENIKNLLGEKLAGVLGKGIDNIVDEVKHIVNNKMLEYLSEEYSRNFYVKTLLHRAAPVQLTSIYQPLYISSTPLIFGGSHKGSPERIPTSSIADLFNNGQFIVIKGNAGSGKSTIVKYLFINSILTNFKIPIKIELRYLNDYEGDIIHYIKDKIFKFQGLAKSDVIIERLMQSGNLVFFLDGYDEIASNKKQDITKNIDDLVKVYNKNFYLLTSRPFTNIDMLPLFKNFNVCNLSNKDIDDFIEKQLVTSSDAELCKKIKEAVHSQENKSYKSFLSNPLLLSMFILTFQSYSNIPPKRSDFYNQVFETLFCLHDSVSKMAFVREKQSGLSKEYFIEILKLFSFISYFDEKFTFSRSYLEEKLQLIKSKKNIHFENQKLINDLQVAIGILTEEGIDFTFPHRSLQEYFAAIYIASLSDQNKAKIYKKINVSLEEKLYLNEANSDNFYLLLSELDRKGVIKYAILPYLDEMLEKLYGITETTSFRNIISYFYSIFRTYSSFSIILDKKTVNTEIFRYNTFFHKMRQQANEEAFMKKKKTKRKKAIEENVSIDLIQEELAEEYIRPFLISYIPQMEQTRKDLQHFLDKEEAIDSDFIEGA